MSDILTAPILAQIQEKVRAKSLIITNTLGTDPNLAFVSEKLVILDGKVVASVRAPPVVRNLAGIATRRVTVIDPATLDEVTISAAGVARVIEELYCQLYTEDEASRNSR